MRHFRGNGGNLAGRVPRMRRFAAEGWGFLFVDYRGYGGNPGRPTEAGLTRDADAATAFADARGIPPSTRVLYGESLGTGVATAAAARTDVAAPVLESPYTSLPDIAARHYPWAPSAC